MINMNFWNSVKEKWIRDHDPSMDAVDGFVSGSGQSEEEIDAIMRQISGNSIDFNNLDSLEDLNGMMEQLADLGVEELPFDALFSNKGTE